jgi:hypothetical protein
MMSNLTLESQISNPEVLFGTNSGGSISLVEISVVRQINVRTSRDKLNDRFVVTSYSIEISSYKEQVNGNKISQITRQRLGTLKHGDLIIIGNVVSNGPKGKVNLQGVTLTVK